jgi:hypothetical protein
VKKSPLDFRAGPGTIKPVQRGQQTQQTAEQTCCRCAPSNIELFRGVVMSHIFTANLSHSSDAWIGVGLIGVYFVWMLYMALMRISKGEHLHH